MPKSIAFSYIEDNVGPYYEKLSKFGFSIEASVVLLSKVFRDSAGNFIDDDYFDTKYGPPPANDIINEFSPSFFELIISSKNLNGTNFDRILSDGLVFQLRNSSYLISILPDLDFDEKTSGKFTFDLLISANIKDFKDDTFKYTRKFEKNNYTEMFDAYESDPWFDRKKEAVNKLTKYQFAKILSNSNLHNSVITFQKNYQGIVPENIDGDFHDYFKYSSLTLLNQFLHTSDLEGFLNDMSVHFNRATTDAKNFVKKLYKLPDGIFEGVTATFGLRKYEFSNNRALTIAQFLYTESKSGSEDYFSLSQCIDEPMGDKRFSDLFKGKGAGDFKNDYIEYKDKRWRFNQFKPRKKY
ncbi:MAG: hypothetical protein ACXVB4_12480 [Pseudobdellovibrionaceae bacterium]